MRKKNHIKKYRINENTKQQATKLIDSIMNNNKKQSYKMLSEMINSRISAKIKKVAQNEHLI